MPDNKNKIGDFCSRITISPGLARTVLIISVLAAGIILSLMRYAAKDETGFLIEAATMSDCILEGRWFGNEAVGWHGFIFKIPAAVLFTIFGRSVFLATFTNIIIAAFTCWLCFGILRKLLNSTAWAFAGTWLVITSYHFVLSLPTFLRDIPVLFTVLLLISAIINKRNRWIIGLCMLLILDAKEGVFFALAPGFVVWVVLDELCSRAQHSVPRTPNPGPRITDHGSRITDHGSRLTTHDSRATGHGSRITAHVPRPTVLGLRASSARLLA